MDGERTLFDLADFEREAVAATPWRGAPLTYTTDYYTPEELRAAFERYRAERGDSGASPVATCGTRPAPARATAP